MPLKPKQSEPEIPDYFNQIYRKHKSDYIRPTCSSRNGKIKTRLKVMQTGLYPDNENQAPEFTSSINAIINTLNCTSDATKLAIAASFVGLRTSCTLLATK